MQTPGTRTKNKEKRIQDKTINAVYLKKEYQEQVLIPYTKVFVLEYASSLCWHRFVYNDQYLFTVDDFGSSGSKEDVLKARHLDFDSIKEKMIHMIK